MDYNNILSKLETLYNYAKNSKTRKSFFLSLINYFDFLYKEKALSFIFNLIQEIRKKDLKEIDQAYNQSLEELRNTLIKIKKFTEENQIKNKAFLDELKKFEDLEKGIIETTGDEIEERFKCLTRGLYYLINSEGIKYKNFYKNFAQFSDDLKEIEWTFSPNSHKYLDLLSKIGRIKNTRPWFFFEKIKMFYEYYFNIEEYQKEAREKFFEMVGLLYIKEDIKTILNKENEPTKFIKKEDYEYYLDNMHFFVKKSLYDNFNLKTKNYYWNYDSKRGIFTINKEKVFFKKESFRAKLLELLTKNEKNIKKNWSWDEIIEEIEGILDETKQKEQKNRVYETGRDINEYIASKTGIRDFLLVNTQNIQINPIYL
ncbi:MAG: hypothetical protein NZM02_02455 [Patescibacteria group bacterium]|nr:hypothetical protein [Patescibacteria group bacterium]